MLLQEDDSEADAQELRKFFTLLESVQRASLEVQTNVAFLPAPERSSGLAIVHVSLPFLCPRTLGIYVF